MKKLICQPVPAERLDQRAAASATGFYYRRRALRRTRFAAPSANLPTLVVAEALRRKAQAERQRDVLRNALYDMPVPSGRNHDGGTQIQPNDSDESIRTPTEVNVALPINRRL